MFVLMWVGFLGESVDMLPWVARKGDRADAVEVS